MLQKVVEYLAGRLFTAPTTEDHPGAGSRVVLRPPGWDVTIVGDDVALTREHTATDLGTYLRFLENLDPTKPFEALLNVERDRIEGVVAPTERYQDRLACTLAKASDFVRLQAGLDTPLTHRAFFLLLQGLRHVLEHADVLLGTVKALKVDATTGIDAEMDRHGVYRIANTTSRTDVCVEIPAEMAVTLPIFRGVTHPETGAPETYTIPLTLTIDASTPTRPTFTLAALTLDDVLTTAREDVLARIMNVLTAAKVPHVVGFGTVAIGEYRRQAR